MAIPLKYNLRNLRVRWRATIATAASVARVSAVHTSRDGCANRAQTETLRVFEDASRAKSASLSTAYLATSPSCSNGKTLGGSRRLAAAIHLAPNACA